MKDEDASLIQSILAGNLDDFHKLVDKYHLMAEQWAFQHVRNISDAEEIAQEAFVEAYFRLDTLREPYKFGSWLRRIVINTAISWLRRRQRTVSFVLFHIANLLPYYIRIMLPVFVFRSSLCPI